MKFKSSTLLLLILTLSCMAIIFYNSSQNGESSSSISTKISQQIGNQVIVDGESTKIDVKKINFFVRKFAHFFQFLVLAIFLSLLILSLDIPVRKGIILGFLIILAYAALDEFHQLFVPGRTAKLSDVFIDTLGGSLGIVIANGTYHFYKVIKKIKYKAGSNDACGYNNP